MSGGIGEITGVDFRWYLDRVHGADYFRRWHRRKDKSGGLLVHKATHHFDLVNWWLASTPRRSRRSAPALLHPGDGRGARPERTTVSGASAAPEVPSAPTASTSRTTPELKSLYLDTE